MGTDRYRRWCFTDHTGHCKELLQFIRENPDVQIKDVRYLVMGLEICPTTGKEHIQGYIELTAAYTMKALRAILGDAHFERTNGTFEDNYTYCTKDGDFVELGKPAKTKQGKRTDLQNLAEHIQSGKTDRELIEDGRIRNFTALKSMSLLRSVVQRPNLNREPPEVHWIYGMTGTGKTRWAYENAGDSYYVHSCNTQWFDGYQSQKCVIFDDLRPDVFSFHFFLRLIDRYTVRVPVKGQTEVLFEPEKIIITTPFKPNHFVPRGEDPNQLTRRITNIQEIDPKCV